MPLPATASSGSLISPPPEFGQMVRIRGRNFVVTHVKASALPDAGRSAAGLGRLMVEASSLDDTGLGEEAAFLWDLEPGAEVIGKVSLPKPTAFDPPESLDAFLLALKWSAISAADQKALQSPFRSGIEIEDYQLDPLVRALRMPRVNLLIADDVGLGKTIETGLVVQELLLRHRARSVLVVCPAGIQLQWQQQMWDKFGLEFRIIDTEALKVLRRKRGLHVNPWNHFPRLITSMDFLKRERPLQLFRDTLPGDGEPTYPRPYDLLIVDEAHNVAPSGRGEYAVDSLRTQAVRTLSPWFEHKLFLSATPHNGYKESFGALLELLDNQRFVRGFEPSQSQLQAVMVRRLKSELKLKHDGTRRFADRIVHPLELDYSVAERRAHQALREYTAARLGAARDQAQAFATEFVLKLLKKRLFSSPAAFATTLEKHAVSVGAKAASASLAALRRSAEELQQEFANDDEFEESAAESVQTASQLQLGLAQDERRLLDELRAFARDAVLRPDTKASELLRWLRSNLKSDGAWNDTRVIIFTEYRATQNWLFQLFGCEGLAAGGRVELLFGGMDPKDRERIKAAFQAAPADAPVRILLATDAASEGIDLQDHCSRLIHFEIPWNPSRLEQRNGRVDRHGQRADEVSIYHFVCAGFEKLAPGTPRDELDADLEFLFRAARKVESIREDLAKVGPVIAAQVEEAMLGRPRRLDTTRAEQDAEPARRLLKFERQLQQELAKLHQQLADTTADLQITPANVQRVVDLGLRLAGQPALIPAGRGRFHLPPLTGGWSDCARGLAHPHTRRMRPITFEHAVAQGRDDVVLVHLNHKLVQMCQQLLCAEVWAGAGRKLNRVTARLVPDHALTNPAVIAFGRLVVTGGDQHRLHEEIIVTGGAIRDGRFARLKPAEAEALLESALPESPSPSVQKRLADLWPQHEESLHQSLDARAKERTASLQRHLDERSRKECAQVRVVMEDMARSIQRYLDEKPWLQLDLFGQEASQRDLDLAALRRRVAEIPAEIELEVAHLGERYAHPTPRLFPVAVTYLVPQRLAQQL